MAPGAVFVGRTREIAAIEALVSSRDARLVTLWGPGGAGKTRLARRFAEGESARGHDVAWADLSAAIRPAEVLATIAAALSITIEAGDDAAAAVAHAAAAHDGWIVADNTEQLD